MNAAWKAALLQEIRKLQAPHAPIWWDGFCNVLQYHQSSHQDDNPYMCWVLIVSVPRASSMLPQPVVQRPPHTV